MTVTLADVVPWGRSLTEYVGMFHLTDDLLRQRILGCADGYEFQRGGNQIMLVRSD